MAIDEITEEDDLILKFYYRSLAEGQDKGHRGAGAMCVKGVCPGTHLGLLYLAADRRIPTLLYTFLCNALLYPGSHLPFGRPSHLHCLSTS